MTMPACLPVCLPACLPACLYACLPVCHLIMFCIWRVLLHYNNSSQYCTCTGPCKNLYMRYAVLGGHIGEECPHTGVKGQGGCHSDHSN